MEPARQRIVRRRQIDRIERRGRSERDEIRRIGIVRQDDGFARLEVLAQRPQLARLEQSAGSRPDGADAVELLFVDDPRKLLAEMERLGARWEDRRAFAAKDRRRVRIVRDGVQAVEAGVGGAPKYDAADGELHGVQLSLDVARAPAPEEDQKRAHTCDASSLPR